MMSTGMCTFFSVWGSKKSQVTISEFRSAKIRFCACVQIGITGKKFSVRRYPNQVVLCG